MRARRVLITILLRNAFLFGLRRRRRVLRLRFCSGVACECTCIVQSITKFCENIVRISQNFVAYLRVRLAR